MTYREYPGPRPADDVLMYAMFSGMVLSVVAAVVGVVYLDVSPIITLGVVGVTGFFWVFTVTPHLVARWLGIHVDDLLRITPKRDLINKSE